MEINQAIEIINKNKSYIASFISLLIAAIYTNDSIQKTNTENEPNDNNTLIIIISSLVGIGFFLNQYFQNQFLLFSSRFFYYSYHFYYYIHSCYYYI